MGHSDDLTAMFKALGDSTRRRIYEFLRSCSCPVAVDESGDVRPVNGPTVGDVCCQINGRADLGQSTVSHHLKELRTAGLIQMERRGKHIVCSIDQSALRALAAYFGNDASSPKDCCS